MHKRMADKSVAEPGLLVKLLTLFAAVILLVVGFMFSVVIVTLIVVVGVVAWGYFWWKTRKLRQTMRQQAPAGGRVIDGEVIVVDDLPDQAQHAPPRGRSGDLPPAQ